GQYGFAPTTSYWPQTHMVAPAEDALQCVDCHGENGRMDWEALGYPGDPMMWGGRDAE
ncbi:MAG: cytochrome C, partial [Anaerolineae bacterium]